MTRRTVAAGGALLALLGACSRTGTAAVELGTVTSGEVTQTVAAPANIEPAGRTPVLAPVSGVVAELLIADGSEVSVGQAVLRLRSEGVELAIAQAQAGLDAAGTFASIPPASGLAPLFDSINDQLASVPGVLDAIDARIAQVGNDALRAQAQAALDDAWARYEQVAEDLARAEAEAAAATRAASAGQRAIAQAQSEQAAAALQAAQAQEDALTVSAPTAGTVEFARDGEAGATVPDDLAPFLPGGGGGVSGGAVVSGARVAIGQVLFTVYDLSSFHAQATVDEVDAVLVATGQGATVLVDAHPDDRFEGEVVHVAIGPEQGETGGVVYPVRVDFDDAGVAFRVGMTASVEIEVRAVESDTVIPIQALLRRESRDVVLLARDGRVHEVEVDVLAIGLDDVAVEGELEPGDRVVVAGFEDLEEGDRIRGT